MPIFSEAVYVDEDGSLCLAANIGNHKGDTYTVKNENEAQYTNNRAKFLAFEDSIPRPNGNNFTDEKFKQYNKFTETEFMFNTTHPPESSGGG